jgi:RimJ/RimL family protein N-acetyltransferase
MNRKISLQPLQAHNWEKCAALTLHSHQDSYLQSNLFVLARSLFEPIQIFAILENQEVVGMLALYCKGQILWISHLMIGQQYQGRGIGSQVLKLIPKEAISKRSFVEMRAGVLEGNLTGQNFFRRAGFVLQGQLPDGELIFCHSGAAPDKN